MTLAANTIQFYKDSDFRNPYEPLDVLGRYAIDRLHSFSGMSMQDEITSLKYRLDPGVVVTLCQDIAQPSLPDLGGLGKTLDLIGDGEEHSIASLSRYELNDRLSGLFYRRIALDIGYIELFENADFKGNRQIVFLAEWPSNELVRLSKWHIQDRLSSARWHNIHPAIIVELYEHVDGKGKVFANLRQRESGNEIRNFKEVGFNDIMSAMRITSVNPVKEKIKAVEIVVPTKAMSTSVLASEGEVNSENATLKHIVEFSEKVTEETSVTIEDSHSLGGSVSYTYSAGGTSFAQHSVTVELHYDWTRTKSNTETKSKTRTLSSTTVLDIPPMTQWECEWIVNVANNVEVSFEAMAVRWYEEPILGGEPDPDNNNWYKRKETIRGRFSGSLYFENEIKFRTEPLP